MEGEAQDPFWRTLMTDPAAASADGQQCPTLDIAFFLAHSAYFNSKVHTSIRSKMISTEQRYDVTNLDLELTTKHKITTGIKVISSRFICHNFPANFPKLISKIFYQYCFQAVCKPFLTTFWSIDSPAGCPHLKVERKGCCTPGAGRQRVEYFSQYRVKSR